MFSCPGCRSRIPATIPTSHWTCPHCRGTHIPFAILRDVTSSSHVRNVDLALRKPLGLHEDHRCLRCGLRMTTLAVAVRAAAVPLEICTRCRYLWYPAGSLRSTEEMDSPAPIAFDGNAAREPDPTEDTAIDWLPSAATAPEEPEAFVPTVTLVGLAALTAGSVQALLDWARATLHYGFFLNRPWRYYGLTWLTASVVPNGWAELGLVVASFYMFGEIVERRLGGKDFARLLIVSTISSRALALTFGSERDLGAIGMVCGVIAFQMLTAPHACVFSTRLTRQGIPAWLAALVFATTVVGWTAAPHQGFSCFGGICGGILCWGLVKLPTRKPSERRKNRR